MASIKDRIKEINKEIEDLEFKLAVKKNVLQELESLGNRKSRRSTKRKNRPPRTGSLVAYLVTVLNKSETPMPVAMIANALKEEGYSTDAKVGLNNLIPSACFKRSDLFFRAKHGVYGLKSKHQRINQEN